jgi:hypothetical protein
MYSCVPGAVPNPVLVGERNDCETLQHPVPALLAPTLQLRQGQHTFSAVLGETSERSRTATREERLAAARGRVTHPLRLSAVCLMALLAAERINHRKEDP